MIRLNELLAEYLSIGLFGFARVDGILLDARYASRPQVGA